MGKLIWVIISLATSAMNLGVAHHQPQPLFQKTTGNLTVTVVDAPVPSLTQIVMVDGAQVGHVEVALPEKVNHYEDVVVGENGRLVLVTEYFPNVIYVIDIAGAVLVDEFLAARPVISPNARFIAYRKNVSRTEEPGSGAVYLVYDLSKSPEQNRMTSTSSMDNVTDVGIAVYPEWNRTHSSYSVKSSDQGAVHSGQSPIRWLNDEWLVFLHQENSSIRAVALRVTQPVVTRQAAVNTAALLPDGQENAWRVVAETIIPLEVTSTSCRVRFKFVSGLRLSSLEVEW